MTDPAIALIAAAGLGTLAVLLFWPVRGLFWRFHRGFRDSERVRMEDALKHVYDCEYRQQVCTLASVAGAVGLSGNRAAVLLSRLEQKELVASSEGAYKLTADGRSHALRVIRVHRLWERYLSDETGLDASEWHRMAEIREHTTSPREAEALARRIGFPRFDPHGDPIPTASGEIAPPRGHPLPDLPVGELAELVHVEDEPEAIYAQLVAEGLFPGQRVRVLESTPRRVRFEADAEEHVLAPVVAGNLWAVKLPADEQMVGPFQRLSGLELGEQAEVVGISRSCRSHERRRLLDLGIIPGTVVKAEMLSPSRDPTAYRVRGALIALRREQADLIRVARVAEGARS